MMEYILELYGTYDECVEVYKTFTYQNKQITFGRNDFCSTFYSESILSRKTELPSCTNTSFSSNFSHRDKLKQFVLAPTR